MKIENGVLTDCGLYFLETRAVIPDGVKKIAAFAFRRARSLREIIIPEGVTYIDKCAFGELERLTDIYIPDSVTYIGECAFEFCVDLSSVRLPEGLKVIENNTFSATSSLKSITLPDSVEEVDPSAFYASGIETVCWRGYELHRSFRPSENISDRLWFTREFTKKLERGIIDRGEISDRYLLTFSVEHFAKHRDDESGGFIAENLYGAMDLIFATDNTRALEALIGYGRFFTAENIDKFIDIAAKVKKHELYLILVGHKESLGGYGGERFGL